MIDKILKEIIINFREQDIYDYKSREQIIPDLKVKKIVSLVGPRRSGKTSVCFLKIKELLNKGLDKKNILYINFEDERLINFTLNDFDTLLKVYFEVADKSVKDKNIYFFLDEIQNIFGWEKFVVRVLNNFNIKIVVTGSSAKMLSREINTALRGKNFVVEVLPLNFNEYLSFKNLVLDKNFEYSIDGSNKYKNMIDEFLKYGAFPEVVLEDDSLIKVSIVKTYYDLIFYRDVVDRFKVRDIVNLKKFRRYLTYNFSNLISLNKFAKEFNVSYPVVLKWFDYFQDVYFGFGLKKFDFSIKDVDKSLNKFYLIDTSFFYVNFGQINELNLSRLFENAVFLELRKRGFIENETIFYYKDNEFDIDFVLFKNGEIIPIQVCYEINKKNFDREYKQLEKFIQKFGLKKGYLIYVKNNLGEVSSDNIKLLRIEHLGEI